jgi:hypothetical protein
MYHAVLLACMQETEDFEVLGKEKKGMNAATALVGEVAVLWVRSSSRTCRQELGPLVVRLRRVHIQIKLMSDY